jgi:hypothetical protein
LSEIVQVGEKESAIAPPAMASSMVGMVAEGQCSGRTGQQVARDDAVTCEKQNIPVGTSFSVNVYGLCNFMVMSDRTIRQR